MFLFILFSLAFAFEDDCVPFSPRVQLGDYYSDKNKEKIIVVFNTKQACPNAYLSLSGRKFPVSSSQFLQMSEWYGQKNTYTTHIHQVILKEVNPGESYEYILYGSDDQTDSAGTYQFKVPYKTAKEATRVVITGNMDVSETSKTTFVWFEAMKYFRTQLDAVVFTGGMAFELEDENCQRGENFLREFSAISGTWPLIVIPGTVDVGKSNKLAFFNSHFHNPSLINYSDLGLLRIYQLNVFAHNPDEHLSEKIMEQLNKPLSPQVKWKIMVLNIPMLCFDAYDRTCQDVQEVRQNLIGLLNELGFHIIFDSYFGLYARTQLISSKNKNIYYHTGESVLISDGVAGCDNIWEKNQFDEFEGTESIYAGQSVGVLTASNDTHLHFQQVSTKDNVVVDEVYIIKGQAQKKSKLAFYLVLTTTFLVIIGVALLVYKRLGLQWFEKTNNSGTDQLVGENELSQVG